MADIVLINPRFEMSYWGMEHALPFIGKRANLPVACLPLLAALTPGEHTVTLIDENVEPIDWERCRRADIVGITGMSVQRFRMKEILTELKQLGCFCVAGGPWVTVQEDYFGELVDVIFVGEAEETWPRFLEEWREGRHSYRYEQAEKTDMTRVPTPRFDLLKMKHYAFGSLQFSRGCPFQCEFWDILVLFGRRPRVKPAEQVVAEVEAQHRLGARVIFLVDDNFIGNKKAAKVILRALVAWQRARGYPLSFFTEASLDLAEDDELMRLMAEAGMVAVFVGIESPDEEALREAKKYQNVRGSIVDRVRRIQGAGLEVYAGMIVGFDQDDGGVFDRQYEFLREARVVGAMAGMLSAIPKAPLYDRLAAEGRLDNAAADDPRVATNVVPLRMSREELRDGWVDLMRRLYDAEGYFERFDALFVRGRIPLATAKMEWLRRHKPLHYLRSQALTVLAALALLARVWIDPRTRPDRRVYARHLWRLVAACRPPRYLFQFAWKCVLHTHFAALTREMQRADARLVNS